MNLVWHIARKDLRRMAAPVAVWIALCVAPTIAFVTAAPSMPENLGGVEVWRSILLTWLNLLAFIQLMLGFVLAGALVLEDPLLGSTAFWMTRPIANGRLLAAKLLAAVLLLLVAPVLCLLPVWLACGFGIIETAEAAARFAFPISLTLIVALAIASLVRTLSQFFFGSIILIAAFAVTALLPAPLWRDVPMAVRAAREWLVFGGIVPALAAIGLHQFLTRRVVRSWALVAAALLAAAAIRCAWPWELPHLTARRAADAWPGGRTDGLAVTSQSPSVIAGSTSWAADAFDVPIFVWSSANTVSMRSDGGWETEAAARLLGLSDPSPTLQWKLRRLDQPATNSQGDAAIGRTLEIWSVRARMLVELPVRSNAEFASGAQRLRVLALGRHDGRLDAMFLRERDTRAASALAWDTNPPPRDPAGIRYLDRYFLVNRRTRTVTPAYATDLGQVEFNSIVLRFRELAFAVRGEPDDLGLVKIRFACERRFEHPLPAPAETAAERQP